MSILRYLEKSQTALLFLLSLLFFFFRFPSLFEPYWYGDEGIYFVIGDALRDGRLLYSEIWDNKPPLLYYLYQFFGTNLFGIRALSLVFGIGALIGFYFLALKILVSKKLSVLSSFVFLLLFATPVLEGNVANAENFMLLPVIFSFLLFLRVIHFKKENITSKFFLSYQRILFFSGLLLGIAFLFKIVAFFDLLSLLFFLLLTTEKSKNSSLLNSFISFVKKERKIYLPLLFGFILPTFLYAISTLFQGNFLSFFDAAYFNNLDYVNVKNVIFLPYDILIFKTILLLIALFLIFKHRQVFPVPFLFVVIWLVFSLFNIFFSQRPYGHYALLLIPSFTLFLFSIYVYPLLKKYILLTAILIITLLVGTFHFFLAPKTLVYYGNFLSFVKGDMHVPSYLSFFDPRTERDYAVSAFIRSHTKSEDTIFLWGENAQVYFMSNKTPPGKYAVAYHIRSTNSQNETFESFQSSKPKYVILFPDMPPFPFPLSEYEYRLNLERTSIYERIN